MHVILGDRNRGTGHRDLRVDVLDIDIEFGPARDVRRGAGRRINADHATGTIADGEVSGIGGVGRELGHRRRVRDAPDVGLRKQRTDGERSTVQRQRALGRQLLDTIEDLRGGVICVIKAQIASQRRHLR